MIVSRLDYIAIQKHVLPSVHYSDVNINICISTVLTMFESLNLEPWSTMTHSKWYVRFIVVPYNYQLIYYIYDELGSSEKMDLVMNYKDDWRLVEWGS